MGTNNYLMIKLVLVFCVSITLADWEYLDFNPYIGYPASWATQEVDYMYGNDPAANMEMGAFIRTPFLWIN